MKSVLILVALLAAVTFATLWRAAVRERQAEADYPTEGRIVTVNGLRVHAVVAGTGPDLVLIHGASGSARDFTFALVARLAPRYRVIAFDRPGLGHTDRLAPGAEGIHAQAALLQAAAAQLGADRPIVLGQSYGGAVALAWALDHPDQIAALVTLAGPSHPWPTPLPRLYRINSHWFGSTFVVPLLTAWVPDAYVAGQIGPVFAPQPMPAGYDAHIGGALTLRRASLRANAAQRAGLLAEIAALVPRYPALTLPFELVHGDADDTVSFTLHALAMQAAAPGAHLTRLPGVGHMPQHVAAAAVEAAIDRAATRAGLR
jgi:pimeloyl-ACP methyl ester carboxylesterase